MTLRSRVVLAGALLGAALAAWIVSLERMRGMDAGPGTDLGALGWFLGIWVTMMAAMMLPSAAPTVLAVSALRRTADGWAFAAGYLLVWSASGLLAYGLYRALRVSAPGFVAWDRFGPWIAGGALAVAGLYQLTPLKDACLRHCRSPLHFIAGGRRGFLGAAWMGAGHGAYCFGCCAGLMLALFALGVMSLFWMALAATAILAEKLLPRGETVARVLGVVLVGLGLWVGTSSNSVPGLEQPSPMRMEMR